MNHFPILLILIIFNSINLQGQNDTSTIYKNLEIKKFYAVNLHYNSGFKGDNYELNGKTINEKTYKKYSATWKNLENCRPCILQFYNENDVLLKKAVSYTDCGVGWFKKYWTNGNLKITGKYKENPTGNWDDIWNRGYCSVPDGEWFFFNEKGDTLYSELWKNGEFLQQIPEQNKTEIWDIKLMLNGEDASNKVIDVKEVGQLKVQPLFKNSTHKTKLRIFFYITAVGYKTKKKKFSLQSFEKINVQKMLSKLGIPKYLETSYTLSVYNKNKAVKSFFLKIKR